MPRTKHSIKVNRQEYYAIISHMDEQIGRILKGLEDSEMKENTYIFFTADHGLGVGHHGLLVNKIFMNTALGTFFIVSGPGIPKNKKISMPVYLQDIMPSTLAIAGVENQSMFVSKILCP